VTDARLRASGLILSIGAAELHELLTETGLSRSNRHLDKIGRYLAFAIGRSRPFTHRYLLSVLNGTLEPGAPLVQAIRQVLAETIDGSVQGIHLLKPRICAEEDCINRFISNHPRRRKCYTCSPVRRKP
jgi:hypothetical protein